MKSTSKSKAKEAEVDWPACQLMLQIEPGPGARERLAAALSAGRVAAVMIQPKAGEQLGAGEVKPLVALAQEHGAAAILYDDVDLAVTLKADGVHVPAGDEAADQVAAARTTLGRDASIGVDAGASRHQAMAGGEAGANYVAFGLANPSEDARSVRDDLVAWWGEIFEVPCVAMDLVTADEVEMADRNGADFASLVVPSSASAEAVAALVGEADMRLIQSSDNGG